MGGLFLLPLTLGTFDDLTPCCSTYRNNATTLATLVQITKKEKLWTTTRVTAKVDASGRLLSTTTQIFTMIPTSMTTKRGRYNLLDDNLYNNIFLSQQQAACTAHSVAYLPYHINIINLIGPCQSMLLLCNRSSNKKSKMKWPTPTPTTSPLFFNLSFFELLNLRCLIIAAGQPHKKYHNNWPSQHKA